jgi:hypothetical protein
MTKLITRGPVEAGNNSMSFFEQTLKSKVQTCAAVKFV